jgi:hypothetical protein
MLTFNIAHNSVGFFLILCDIPERLLLPTKRDDKTIQLSRVYRLRYRFMR